eukprot:CAMPEP_0183710724 /NCGR_PEP_ID=MMETSP0737-20130205/6387_1 /TAXON_ID=385413 /ORGANISM="Thalassiosira miniscula, Strain CCMP1093" /LENGTH=254 /DNA_ID=CAMNT_0025939053 /DNA_START=159 /DNA_END=923 /DNA_ORIENTATION=+
MIRSTLRPGMAAVLLVLCGNAIDVSAFRSTPTARPRIARHPAPKIETPLQIRHASKGLSASSSALSAFALPSAAVVGAGVANFYKGSPLVAGFLTASTKAAVADSTAQYRDTATTKFDIRRNISMALYSGLVLGILVELMYNNVFPRMFAPQGSSLVRALKMTFFDAFINAPFLWLPPAYIAKAMVYRNSKREAIRKYITDVKEYGLLKKYWSLWLPMTMINFLFVPEHFRVAFVASVSFFWMIILSVVANNGK